MAESHLLSEGEGDQLEFSAGIWSLGLLLQSANLTAQYRRPWYQLGRETRVGYLQ